MNALQHAERISRRTDHSTLMDHAVRVGLVAYGVEHLLLAWLALQVALGDKQKVSSKGALSQLAGSDVGRLTIYGVAVGFGALVLWQLLEAAGGHRDEEGGERALKRAVSLGKALFYGALGYSALQVATGSASSRPTDSWTAQLMAAPGGQLLVAAVGLGILVVAGVFGYRGWHEKFRSKMDGEGTTGQDGRAYLLFGKVGYLAKAVAFAVVGGLFLWAAASHDPERSGGLDVAFGILLAQPLGPALVAAVAAGIGCFGLFCFAWARHLSR